MVLRVADSFLMLRSILPGILSHACEFPALPDVAWRQSGSRPDAQGAYLCTGVDYLAVDELVAGKT